MLAYLLRLAYCSVIGCQLTWTEGRPLSEECNCTQTRSSSLCHVQILTETYIHVINWSRDYSVSNVKRSTDHKAKISHRKLMKEQINVKNDTALVGFVGVSLNVLLGCLSCAVVSRIRSIANYKSTYLLIYGVQQGDRMKTYHNGELPRLRAATGRTQQNDVRATSAPSHTDKTLQVNLVAAAVSLEHLCVHLCLTCLYTSL